MLTLKCLECEKPGRWHVWYKHVVLPIGMSGHNIAYNTLCDEHVALELIDGRAGYPVACIKLVQDQFLPEDDVAKIRPDDRQIIRCQIWCDNCQTYVEFTAKAVNVLGLYRPQGEMCCNTCHHTLLQFAAVENMPGDYDLKHVT